MGFHKSYKNLIKYLNIELNFKKYILIIEYSLKIKTKTPPFLPLDNPQRGDHPSRSVFLRIVAHFQRPCCDVTDVLVQLSD